MDTIVSILKRIASGLGIIIGMIIVILLMVGIVGLTGLVFAKITGIPTGESMFLMLWLYVILGFAYPIGKTFLE